MFLEEKDFSLSLFHGRCRFTWPYSAHAIYSSLIANTHKHTHSLIQFKCSTQKWTLFSALSYPSGLTFRIKIHLIQLSHHAARQSFYPLALSQNSKCLLCLSHSHSLATAFMFFFFLTFTLFSSTFYFTCDHVCNSTYMKNYEIICLAFRKVFSFSPLLSLFIFKLCILYTAASIVQLYLPVFLPLLYDFFIIIFFQKKNFSTLQMYSLPPQVWFILTITPTTNHHQMSSNWIKLYIFFLSLCLLLLSRSFFFIFNLHPLLFLKCKEENIF